MAGSVNKVILVGNLGKDPDIRRTQDGRPIANFSIATSESWQDKNSGERREKTEWHRVVCFNEGLSEGRIPPAIPATHRWDRKAIDEALDRLSGIKTNDGLSELEQWRLKKANAHAS